MATRNLRLTLEYDGTAYHGWQIQPNVSTVQGCLQEVIERITQETIHLIGAGRTDTGVHALGQVANFHTHSHMTPEAFQKALNALLPADIVIREVVEVSLDFHARYDATRRFYRYAILNRPVPSAFERHYALHVAQPLDVERLDAMVQPLVGTHDFSSFQKTGSDRQHPTCTVYEARWRREGDKVFLDIAADSFLRGMVRAIVGTCLQWHRTDDAVARMEQILAARDRSAAGPSAPPHGLYLVRVEYERLGDT